MEKSHFEAKLLDMSHRCMPLPSPSPFPTPTIIKTIGITEEKKKKEQTLQKLQISTEFCKDEVKH